MKVAVGPSKILGGRIVVSAAEVNAEIDVAEFVVQPIVDQLP